LPKTKAIDDNRPAGNGGPVAMKEAQGRGRVLQGDEPSLPTRSESRHANSVGSFGAAARKGHGLDQIVATLWQFYGGFKQYVAGKQPFEGRCAGFVNPSRCR
jgi:hypothetical protein